MGCHALLQGSLPSQGLNPGLLHCRQILNHLSHQGSPSRKFKECKTHRWNTKVKRELAAHEDKALERLSGDNFLQRGAVKLGMGGVPGEDGNHPYPRF